VQARIDSDVMLDTSTILVCDGDEVGGPQVGARIPPKEFWPELADYGGRSSLSVGRDIVECFGI
jgi:hypothetical protein